MWILHHCTASYQRLYFIPLVPHVMVVSCQATGTSQHSGHGRELRTEIQVVFLVADASASASALSGPYMEKYI